ncbi:hypothetical protein G3I15_35310 [Streptomyces sp. SID10244]|nr:hypothetical protein [Streptomyces sp. SID10244]
MKQRKFAGLVVMIVTSFGAMADAYAAPTAAQLAREMADAVAPSLPMRINQNLTMQTVVAGGNAITYTANFSYTREQMNQVLAQSGKSDAEARVMMRNAAKGGVCAQGPEGRAFLALGGRVRYLYRFVDGSPYELIEISACS